MKPTLSKTLDEGEGEQKPLRSGLTTSSTSLSLFLSLTVFVSTYSSICLFMSSSPTLAASPSPIPISARYTAKDGTEKHTHTYTHTHVHSIHVQTQPLSNVQLLLNISRADGSVDIENGWRIVRHISKRHLRKSLTRSSETTWAGSSPGALFVCVCVCVCACV